MLPLLEGRKKGVLREIFLGRRKEKSEERQFRWLLHIKQRSGQYHRLRPERWDSSTLK